MSLKIKMWDKKTIKSKFEILYHHSLNKRLFQSLSLADSWRNNIIAQVLAGSVLALSLETLQR
jgi:hypothetical protein